MIHNHHQVKTDQAGRVDRVVETLAGIARRNLRPLFDQGAVTINGAVCDGPWARLTEGDRVEVRYDPRQKLRDPSKFWKDSAFRIVFEDEHLIVVDKAAFILTVPAAEGQTNTLVHRIMAYLTQGRKQRHLAYIVHRLDQGVSGLLVFGKTQQVADRLKDQFEAHKPQRRYVAIVAGTVGKKKGTFRSYLATDERLNRFSTNDPERGELAITHYGVDRVFDGLKPPASLVHIELETGRRNQIRVHFAEAGHPVLGDSRYEPKLAKHPRWHARRIALHAATLGFQHPVTGQALRLESPLPLPMARFIASADTESNRSQSCLSESTPNGPA